MKNISRFIVLGSCLIFFSCSMFDSGSPKKDTASKKNESCGSVPQDFKTDVAWIVVEWNCKPDIYGSGFLINKEHGAFYTNKHVSNEFNANGKGSHKLYFNGRFYNVEIVKVPPLRDAAMVRITDPFDPSEFPEPAPFATEKVKIGDRVFVEGFHPHPYSIIESDKTGGYIERLVPIWDKHYNLATRQKNKGQEVVFEKITGRVKDISTEVSLGTDDIDRVRKISNSYIMVKADRDHKLPFGGLSGTVVRNRRGEIIGIFTMGPDKEFEEAENIDGVQHMKRVYKTFGFTPIESVAGMMKYLEKR